MLDQTSIQKPVEIRCQASAAFEQWFAQAGGSLCVSTYQAGKVAMIGWDGRQITLLMRDFDKPLGMTAVGKRLLLATRNDLTIFSNAQILAHDFIENQPGRYDALYLPRATYHTGDLNTHDVVVSTEGIVLVATRFSCLARLSFDFNFVPFWKPRYVTDLVPEDRCHLNGLALVENKPKYVTAFGTTDSAGAWRENKANGGVVIDVPSNEIIAQNLSMPHSPDWYDGRLWVLNSGAGEFLVIDPQTGRQDAVCALPGYLRGLCFIGPYAIIGLSKIREKHIFGGLPVQSRFERLLCGLAVIDIRTGQEAGFFEFTEGCEELYGVQFLPGVSRPMILNLDKPAARQAMSNPESAFWLRPSSEIRDNTIPFIDEAGNAAACENGANTLDFASLKQHL
jgi:uncharacterized protein (TIGR03032 family)